MSDELRLLARPVTVLDRRAGLGAVLSALSEMIARENVTHLVVGLPLNEDGSEGRQARRAHEFARVAARVTGMPLTMWDERLSTRAAEDIVRAQGRNLRRVRQRGELDAVAAAAILQDYLDHCPPGEPS